MSNKEELRNIIEEVFNKIDPDIKLDFILREERSLDINLRAKDPQVLIGEKGQTLIDTERLLKIIIRKKIKETVFINLDINGYKKRKADYLKDLAMEAADEVSLTGIEKKFPPMNAHERRIVHMVLSDKEDITTESINEGSERRVVIKQKRI